MTIDLMLHHKWIWRAHGKIRFRGEAGRVGTAKICYSFDPRRSDVHGNSIALDAVLNDIEDMGGVDACWVLGDLAAIGYGPVTALERLAALPNAYFVRGNTDRYVVTGDRPEPTLKEAQANPRLLPTLVRIASGFSWTQGCLTATGWLDWLAQLPLERRLTLSDGTRLLGVHARPGHDDCRPGLHPGLSDTQLETLISGCEADLVCVGHSHWPMDRGLNGVRVVNLGSVSNPITSSLRASYVLLEADGSGYRLEHREVNYDREAVIEALQRSRHPSSNFIISHFRGQRGPGGRTSL